MTRKEVEDYFQEVTGHSISGDKGHAGGLMYLLPDEVHAFASGIAAAERREWPDLEPVINWLENGCDPKEAAKELRTYAEAIRARGQE